MKTIKKIQQLIQHLSVCSRKELSSVYKYLSIPESEYASYMFWSKENYTRNCIVRTNKYELILICWEKGQYTSIHSHGNQECWVYNVKGSFEEIRFRKDKEGIPSQSNALFMNKNETSYINDKMGFHVLKNNFDGRSVSLHLYAKPIEECLVYNNSSKQFEVKSLKYYSINGKLIDSNKI